LEIQFLSLEYLSLINELEISVISGGIATLDKNWKQDIISYPFTRMYVTASGHGHVWANGQCYDLTPNTVCILPTGLDIGYDCPHAMKQIFFHLKVNKDGHDLFQACHAPLFYDVGEEAIQQLETLMKSDRLTKAQQTRSFLRTYILRAFEDYDVVDSPKKRLSSTMHDILAFIDTHLSARLTVETLTATFNLSRSKLQRDFKQALDVTPKEYIHSLLLVKAEHLLFNTTCSIKEISDQLGFCDQFYFSKCFLQKYGMAPLQYKQAHLKR